MFVIRAILVIAYLSLSCAIPFKANAEIIFDAKVNNKDVKLLFDTGSEAT